MKISTAGRYALRSMLDLALHVGQGPVLRQDIAERQELSPDYIAQIFRNLIHAGLVKSVMGPGGGYSLALQANTISVGVILRAVEGPVSAVYCVDPHNEQICPRMASCASHLVWLRLTRVIDEFLDSIMLSELCDQSISLQQAALASSSPVDELINHLTTFQPPETNTTCGDVPSDSQSRSNS
jgi:Rrf2 family protein